MSNDMLETYIRGYIDASPGPYIYFVWHGGEPTLAGLDFYRRAVDLQKQYLPEGWTCWNNLQTNGTLLDDSWCSFLAEERFEVGISLDGTKWLHDAFRKDRQGRGSYLRVVEAVKRLQSYGIQPDLLCTVTSAVAKDPIGVYRSLRNLNTGWVQFIPIVVRGQDGWVTPESVSPEAYGNFLSSVFDQWASWDIGKLDVQIFAEMSLVWAGGSANVCWMAPTCGRTLVVEHDGSVYSCDHFVNSDHRIGHIETASLGTLVDSEIQRSFGTDKHDLLPQQCLSCPWLSVCNGGCPKDRFINTKDGEPGLNYLCPGLKEFFAHVERPLKRIIHQRLRRVNSEAIMVEWRAQLTNLWRGIGRNDPCPCGSGLKAKRCCWAKRP